MVRYTLRLRCFIYHEIWFLISAVDAKATFESISSIYIYSLQPTMLQDINVLTDVNREMLVNHAQEDPLEYGKQWGMIQNANVKVLSPTQSSFL